MQEPDEKLGVLSPSSTVPGVLEFAKKFGGYMRLSHSVGDYFWEEAPGPGPGPMYRKYQLTPHLAGFPGGAQISRRAQTLL
jgi:hypothetical protein